MKTYLGNEIRNLAFVGHSHCGKTTLIEALLATAGTIATMGSVEDGTAVTAYDEEEVSRRVTLANAVAFCDWSGVKINLIDTPGFNMFVPEARSAMLPVEAVAVVVDAVEGPQPMTQRVWDYAEEFKLPRILVINGVDRERATPETVLENLRASFGRTVTPVELPIGEGASFSGIVDLIAMQAYDYRRESKGRGQSIPIPKDLLARAQAAHEALVELVAEGKDELLEEFFNEGTLSEEHLVTALHEAIREDRIFPVMFSSGLAENWDRPLTGFFSHLCARTDRAPPRAGDRIVGKKWEAGKWRRGRNSGKRGPAGSRQRPSFTVRLQDNLRPICWTNFLLQSLLGLRAR